MTLTITEAQGSYPTLYIDGEPVTETFYPETMYEAERVQVEWGDVSNGYVSEGYRCVECDETFETRDEADSHTINEHGTEIEELSAAVEHVAPLVNSAAIEWSGKTFDGVTVSISVGDPRGAFAFTVRRLDDGTMLLHTPYPGEGMPHMELTELHPGTYKIT